MNNVEPTNLCDLNLRTFFTMSRNVCLALSLLKVLHSDKGLELQFLGSQLDNDLIVIMQLCDHHSTENPSGSGRWGFLGENT